MTLQRKLRIVNADATNGQAVEEPTVRVAFASGDRRHVDQHFGAAAGFVIYQVSATRYELLAVAQFDRLDMDGNEDKLTAKLDAITGCIAVYCLAVGASAIAQLKLRGVQPIKVTPETLISGLLRDLQRDLRQGPSAWLARAIEQQTPRSASRFDAMEAEGWSE